MFRLIQNKFFLLHALLFIGSALWFLPSVSIFFYSLDKNTFLLLNHSLTWHTYWLHFWGYLNHPYENWLNVIIMVFFNLLIIAYANIQDRKKLLADTLFYWGAFQFILLFQAIIFGDLLNIHRPSPSLVLHPTIWLSKALGISAIKDASSNSFPAGHTLIAIYWVSFSLSLTKQRWLKWACVIIAIHLCVARLFSGAHWLSDCLFTIVLARIYYGWMHYFRTLLCKR